MENKYTKKDFDVFLDMWHEIDKRIIAHIRDDSYVDNFIHNYIEKTAYYYSEKFLDIMYKVPFEDLPNFINYKEYFFDKWTIDIGVAARWRLKIGK